MAALQFPADELRRFTAAIFAGLGLPGPDALTVADCLVAANLRGVDTHGVFRVPTYARRLRAGLVAPRPALRLERVATAAAALDGGNGMGAVVGTRAMAEAIALAGQAGIGLVAVRHSTHYGMAAYYVLPAVAAGLIGMAFTNASPALPPWGGRAPFFGTNPLAIGVPSGRAPAFVLDMAMSVLARGNVHVAAAEGAAIPAGLALDALGRPTTDPQALLDGGTMLPFGGVKGAGLAMLMDILGGVLSGAAFAGRVGNPHADFDRPQDAGHLFVAVRPDLVMPQADFLARMDALIDATKAQPRAAGAAEILIPGEREARTEAERRRTGIPLAPDLIARLAAEGTAFGLAFPAALGSATAASD
jgi:LDH2 family malate/lactate/ureidoglycolate dehydrogenase